MSDRTLRLKCSAGQYDAVVAISEEMLNAQLKDYWKRVKKFQKIEETLDNATLTASLKASRVTIPSEGGSCQMYYHVIFDTATLKTPNGSVFTLDSSDLAFKVDIALQHASEADLPHLQELLNVPGEFSVQRLMLDFGLAEVSAFDPSHSSVKLTGAPDAGGKAAAYLQKLTASWLVHHSDVESALNKMIGSLRGGNNAVKFPILYYALPPNKGQVGHTGRIYQPTAARHQLYPFQRGDGQSSQNSASNCLLYLETTAKNGQLPAEEQFPNSNGIFVTADGDPNQRVKGSMCISSRLIFDNYLVPVLRPIIKRAELDCISASASSSSRTKPYEWSYRFGDNVQHPDWNDDYFLMTRQQGRDDLYDSSGWFNNRVPEMDNYHGWRWLGAVDIVGTAERTVRPTAKLTGRSIVNLKYESGTNKAVLTGWSTMELHMRSSDNWEERSTQIATTGKWKMEIFLESVDAYDGKLNIRLNWPDQVDFKDWKSSSMGVKGIDPRAVFDEFHANFKKSLEGVGSYVDELQGTLKQDCFVLAGNGYLCMKNPIFNDKGDLLVDLTYNGIPPGAERLQQITPTAQVAQIKVPAVMNATATPSKVSISA
ncbi:hypothetical protein F4825DRAFT_473951 [Nemania diffusa]|nr:hypothetical protein F4825DRAFT_473951 [Nemania diffusa]